MSGAFSSGAVRRATFWTVVDLVFERGLNFAVIVILARLLTPAEFGTVALLAIFTALATLLADGGMGQALIQRQDITDDDISTVFWFNIGVAGLLAAALAALSPLIAAFFSTPVLVPLTRILAIGIFMAAFGTVQRALIARRMAFRSLAVVRAGSSAVSGVVAIALAFHGQGVFALAAQTCVAAFVTSAMLWWLNPWRPHWVFRKESVRKLFGFGGYMLVSSLLEAAYSRAYTLLIGKFQGTSALGQYARAEGTTTLVSALVNYPISQIALPTLSRFNGDKERIGQAMSTGLRTSMLVNAPALLGLSAVAEPFIRLFYGEQWDMAVPLLHILCLGGVFMPLHMLNLQVLLSLGRADLFFRLEVLKKLVGVVFLIVASFMGPTGIAWGVVLAGFVGAFINMSQAARMVGYGTMAQMRDTVPIMLGAGVMAAGAYVLIGFFPQFHEASRLALGVAFGAVTWPILALGLNLGDARNLLANWKR